VNVPKSPDLLLSAPYPLTTSDSNSSLTTEPGGRDDSSASGHLALSREEDVKDVVYSPKTKQKTISSSTSTTSLNPFEKRTAPKPPVTLSEPKTKSNKQRREMNI